MTYTAFNNDETYRPELSDRWERTLSSYWEQIKEDAESILRRKLARSRRVRLDDTALVLSINDRSQRDLTKRFEATGIDWIAVEKPMLVWGHLYRIGKKSRLQISINYMKNIGPPSRTDKRGETSVTKRMLAGRDAQIDAEQVSGQPSVWRDV
ncbi:uncharacterized protein AKAW2_30565S [Aspergillus luchuensis]|uniref:Uncharacterized protein n=1 Tax=Aspergillus kawachii TaxID=1069201 RepID=A0A7R7W6M2_ASPKA|nr:uncharacterized protein AKAW2_30565S [Aspergillus luchuensis]BCR97246.1 hypothetical protein AKAW2_30565S [Aspergillus luchuensis]